MAKHQPMEHDTSDKTLLIRSEEMKHSSCPSCGASIDAGAHYCNTCGAQVAIAQPIDTVTSEGETNSYPPAPAPAMPDKAQQMASASAIQAAALQRRIVWLLLWFVVALSICIAVVSHRVNVYNGYTQGTCTVSSVSTVMYTLKNGTKYPGAIRIVYTITNVSSQTVQRIQDEDLQNGAQYAFGGQYPCWYNPDNLGTVSLDKHSGVLDSFPVFMGGFSFPFVYVWSAAIFMLLGLLLFNGNAVLWVARLMKQERHVQGVVAKTSKEQRNVMNGRCGGRRTVEFMVSWIGFRSLEGIPHAFKVKSELEPHTSVQVWYHPSDPEGHAYIQAPSWGDANLSIFWSVFFFCVLLVVIYVGWTVF